MPGSTRFSGPGHNCSNVWESSCVSSPKSVKCVWVVYVHALFTGPIYVPTCAQWHMSPNCVQWHMSPNQLCAVAHVSQPCAVAHVSQPAVCSGTCLPTVCSGTCLPTSCVQWHMSPNQLCAVAHVSQPAGALCFSFIYMCVVATISLHYSITQFVTNALVFFLVWSTLCSLQTS